MSKIQLLIVDPQIDFHPAGEGHLQAGTLAVPGANEDSTRIATLIKEVSSL